MNPVSNNDLVTILEAQAACAVLMPDSGRYIHLIDAWEHLSGPAGGTVTLPAHLSEYDGEHVELDQAEPHDVHRLYERVVNFGSATDQGSILNPGILRAHWACLPLADDVKSAWESRFPQLMQATSTAE